MNINANYEAGHGQKLYVELLSTPSFHLLSISLYKIWIMPPSVQCKEVQLFIMDV